MKVNKWLTIFCLSAFFLVISLCFTGFVPVSFGAPVNHASGASAISARPLQIIRPNNSFRNYHLYAKDDSGLGPARTEETSHKVLILTYHHIITDETPINPAIVTADKFRSDMEAIKEAGYTTIFAEDLVQYVDGKKALPQKPVLITFDDGYLSNYSVAWPVLKELDMKATISVIGWSVGRKTHKDKDVSIIPHFSWEQAKEMVDSGTIDIQNHSYDLHYSRTPPHRDGVLIKKAESIDAYTAVLINDCKKMTDLIQENIGKKPFVFAYPFGYHSALSEQILHENGYSVTLTSEEGSNTIKKGVPGSLYDLKRIHVSQELSAEALIKLMDAYALPESHKGS